MWVTAPALEWETGRVWDLVLARELASDLAQATGLAPAPDWARVPLLIEPAQEHRYRHRGFYHQCPH